MASNVPARSAPEVDFLRRLGTRERTHAEIAGPFLTDDERQDLDLVLRLAVDDGVTPKVERKAYALLVAIQARDAELRFLNSDERQTLQALTSNELPAKATSKKGGKGRSHKQAGSVSGGEFLAIVGVVVSVGTAIYFTNGHPHASDSAFWVGVWGVMSGSGFIGDIRYRNRKKHEYVSALAGLLVLGCWAAAAAAIVVLGPAWGFGVTAFLGFMAAASASLKVLMIEDED